MNGMTVVSRCAMMAAHTVVWLATSHPFCRRALDCRGNQHAEDAFHILRGGKHDFDSTVLLRTLDGHFGVKMIFKVVDNRRTGPGIVLRRPYLLGHVAFCVLQRHDFLGAANRKPLPYDSSGQLVDFTFVIQTKKSSRMPCGQYACGNFLLHGRRKIQQTQCGRDFEIDLDSSA